MVEKKCRSKYGPTSCGNPNCPELSAYIADFVIPTPFITQAANRTTPVVPLGAWTNKDTVLFKTPHGSKLYGLGHAKSDDDYFVVTPTRYVSRKSGNAMRKNNARQTISGDIDTVFMDFKTFTRLASDGVPQALETMFSKLSRSDFFEDYRQAFFCSDPEVIHRYMRTIKSFSKSEKDLFKRRRHALRLSLNLEEILYTGRFDPTLTRSNASKITRFAGMSDENYLKELKAICPIEVDWDLESQNNKNKQ